MLDAVVEMLRKYPEIAVFLTLTLGFFAGQLKIGSFSLGTVAATLLIGVVVGLADVKIAPIAKSLFFDLFIFTIGYKIGPQFFRAFKAEGIQQAILTIVYCVTALLAVYITALVMGYDKGLAAGLLAGAVTESAAIGSATEAINRLNVSDAVKATMTSNVAVAYAVTYIFGTVGATWFLSRVGPKVVGVDLKEECAKAEAELGGKDEEGVFSIHTDMIVRAYKATGPKVANRTVRDFEAEYGGRVAVERVRHGSDVIEAEPDTMINAGDAFSMVGPRGELTNTPNDIGEEVYDREVLDFPLKSLDVVVTNKSLEGLTITRIGREHGRGVRIMKIIRMGEQMPIMPNTRIYRGDTLTLFGTARDAERAAGVAGYVDRASARVGMVWIGTGIVLGALLGIPALVVGDVAITLSTAGGILVMGLIFGFFRARHPVFGRMPAAAEWVFENVGLATFVAIVGLTGSVGFFAGIKVYGVGLLLVGLLIALTPPTVMLLFGRFVFPKMNRAVLLGVASGASTTTASLHALQEVSGSRVPSLGYTVPYAIGGVLTVAWGPVLVAIVPNMPQ